MPADRRAGRHIPHVGNEPRARTKSGGWRKKRSTRQAAGRQEREPLRSTVRWLTYANRRSQNTHSEPVFPSVWKLRDDAEEFGETRGLTLSSALAALVEQGLEAAANERSLRRLERLAQQQSQELAVLQERDRNWQAWAGSVQGQLRTLRVGQCPACRQIVTAFDQFLVQRCPWANCRKPLQQVLPLGKSEDVAPALAGLVGALGGFLFGVAASQSGTP